MKTTSFKSTNEIFNVFALLSEEMINVRGGGDEGDPIVRPTPPPIKI
jgi:hypothetical protein